MHGDVIAAGFGECFEIGIGRRDHQMRVEDLLCVRAYRLDDIGAVGNVGDEMAVHHVEMDPVGAGRIDGADLLAQSGKIRRQDRRRDDEGAWRELLGHVRLPVTTFVTFCGTASRNMRWARGQCRRPDLLVGGKFCRRRHLLPGAAAASARRNPSFYWVFRRGTRFAERSGESLRRPRPARHFVGVLPCCLPLARYRRRWTRCSRWPHRNRLPPKRPALVRQPRACSISPAARPVEALHPLPVPAAVRRYRLQTMSALIAAQSQSGATASASDQSVERAAGPVLPDRHQWRRPDHQIGVRKRARRRRHQSRAGRRRLQQARYQWRRHGEFRRIVEGAERGASGGHTIIMPAVRVGDGSDRQHQRDRAPIRSAGAFRCIQQLRHQ